MTIFQLTIYKSLSPKTANDFESLFKSLINQFDVYKNQFDLTIKTYLKEWDDEKKKINDFYNSSKKEADKIFNENYNPSDEHSNQYDEYISELNSIEHYYYESIVEIDKKYKEFLDLFCKSTIIALYSLNETYLNKITNLSSDLFKKKIKPNHFNSKDYLNSSILYLELVIEIETNNLEKYISKLKDIQFLRNTIIHNLSEFSDVNVAKKKLEKYSDSLEINDTTGLVTVYKSKFVKDFYNLLRNFYNELSILIDQKQNFQILQNGFLYFFRALDRKLEISNLTFKNSSNEIKLHLIINSDKLHLKNINCKINYKVSNKSTFTYTIQSENESLEKYLKFEEENKGNELNDILAPLNFTKSLYNITLLIS